MKRNINKKLYIMICRILLLIAFLLHEVNYARYISLKAPKIHMRVGPGKEYPVSWVMFMQNFPVLLIAVFDKWYKIHLYDSSEGWVHENMISRKNTALVFNNYVLLYKNSNENYPILKLEKNVVVNVIKRDQNFVKIEVNKIKGWMKCTDLWGINLDDTTSSNKQIEKIQNKISNYIN